MTTTLPLPTGTFRNQDPRSSGRRLVNCMSEISPQTSEADLKSKIPPVYLRRMAGISPYAALNSANANPVLLLHMDPILQSAPASLLLHFDGTNGSTSFPDSSVNNFPMTASGTPAVTTSGPEFGSGCLLMGGNSVTPTNSISTPISALGPLDLTTGDFTVEFWLNTTAAFCSLLSASYSFGNGWALDIESSGAGFCLSARFGTQTLFSIPNFPTNVWTHVAWVRQGNNFGLWQGGVSTNTTTFSGSLGASATTLFIGYTPLVNVTQNYKMDDLRITKGLALYTPGVAFAVPAGPLTTTGTVATGGFTDSSLTNATMAASGGAVLTQNPAKFGTGSGSFPSATFTSILTTSPAANGPLDLFGPTTGGDFTIEGFFQAPSFASPIVLVDYGNTGSSTHNGIVIEVNSGTSITVTPSIVGWTAFNNSGAASLPVNTWIHFALVRQGSKATFYLNGLALPNGATNWISSANSPGQITFGASATVGGASQPFFLDEVVVYKTAKFTANFTPQLVPIPNPFVGSPIPPVRGIWEMAGVTYTVIGDSLYSFVGTGTTTFPTNVATLTLIGSGIAGTGFVRMCDNTKCLLILLPNTNVAYTFTLANGLQQLLDETFTFFGAKDVWFIDDFMVFLATNGLEFYNDDGQIVSGTGPITFTTGGVFPREFGTDPFVGMCVDHRTIHLFGTRTSEGYVDVGNAQESPFAAAPDAFMQIGCHPSCGYTVALQDQAVMWVANDLTVRRLNGQTPIRISNSGIESFLEQNKLLLAGSYALCPTIGGHPLWVLTIPLASKSLVYDCLTTEWFELSSLVNNLGYWRPFCYFNSQGLQLVGDSQTGSIGFLDANTFTEFGLPQAAIFYTQSVYDNHNRIRHQRLELVMTPGGSTSITATARVVLLSSDNSGAYFVARPARSLGTEGNRRARAIWFKLGMSRDRAYGFQVSDPTPTFTVQTTIDVSGGKW